MSSAAPAKSMRCCSRSTVSWNLRNSDQAASAQRDVDEEDPAPVRKSEKMPPSVGTDDREMAQTLAT